MSPAEPRRDLADELTLPAEPEGERPHHGYRGTRPLVPAGGDVPAGLTIAVSREAGSRGSVIGSRVGAKLGWPVYNQELLEYIAQEGAFRQDVVNDLPPDAAGWVSGQLERLLREQNLSQ